MGDLLGLLDIVELSALGWPSVISRLRTPTVNLVGTRYAEEDREH